MRALRGFLLGIALFGALLGSRGGALAQTEHPQQTVLRQLYAADLQSTREDPSIKNRIRSERDRVRKAEADDLAELVASYAEEAGVSSAPSSGAKQLELVDALDSRRKDVKVDLDLVGEELESMPVEAPERGTERTAYFRAKGDLFARKAILEERLSAIEEVYAVQQERLERLQAEDRSETFVDFVRVGGIILAILALILVERGIRGMLIARIRDRNRRYLAMKLFTGTVYTVVIGWGLYRLFADYPGIITSFAILGAGIALALQAVIKDLVGWAIIMQKRLFSLGQRVSIGPYVGDIADISLLRTTLVEIHNTQHNDVGRIGQTLYLPNSMVLEHPVLNFHATSDFMETETQVVIKASSDWKKAEEILHEVLQKEVAEFPDHARSQFNRRATIFFLQQEPMSPRVFLTLDHDKVTFTLRFQVPIGQRRSIISRITGEILSRFKSADPPIELASA